MGKLSAMLSVAGFTQFLICAGFQDTGDRLELPSNVNLKIADGALKSFAKESRENQQRNTRDLKLNAIQERDAKIEKNRGGPYFATRGERTEDRKRLLEQIEGDRKWRHERWGDTCSDCRLQDNGEEQPEVKRPKTAHVL